jgi:stalled ribosome rescue protein Dom34
MSNKKQFGVWMDTQHATIVGRKELQEGAFEVIAHVKGETNHGNSNEHNANNHEITLTSQYFKEIASHMPNVDELHITGTGTIQEQFSRFLSETAQYKDTVTSDSTSNKMSDEALVEYFTENIK